MRNDGGIEHGERVKETYQEITNVVLFQIL